MRRFLLFAVALAGCLSFSRIAEAQVLPQTDSCLQRYVIVVPGNVQIICPPDVLIVHDTLDADQVFPVQQWEVRGNVLTGVTTTFEVLTPFVHSITPADVRDVQLDVAIASTLGPANWTVDVASDSTNIAAGPPDNDALVQISSDFVGWAFADLTVTFVDGSFGSLLAGTYETTVIGTVTEN